MFEGITALADEKAGRQRESVRLSIGMQLFLKDSAKDIYQLIKKAEGF